MKKPNTKRRKGKMKKMLLALVAVLVCFSVQAFAATVSIPDTDVSGDKDIVIPVVVDNAANITGFQFTVTYDASIFQAIGAEAGDLNADWMVTPNMNEAGKLKVAGLSTTLQSLRSGSGSLAKLKFKLLKKLEKNSTLSFGVCSLADSSGKKLSATCKEGRLRIKGPKKEK
jgi:Cohesin domain